MNDPHGHSRRYSHAAETRRLGDARLVAAIAVNALLTVAQIIGGALSGSLSLVADALHNLSDAGSLLVALVARRIGRRPADRVQTFGYRRVELVGALINATSLVAIGLYLLYESIVRFLEPREVGGWTVVIVAFIALVVDLVTALLTYAMARGNLNVKAAFVHNVTDALGSVAVIIAGTLIILYELHMADVVATLLIAGYAVHQGVSMTRESARILTLGAPRDVDLKALVLEVLDIEGVEDVHHVHLWQLDEENPSFEAHVLVSSSGFAEADKAKGAVKAVLARYGIRHSTLELEFECTDDDCGESGIVVPH
jgi:cobalt-zinc-cadmium efflux system protein